ncbi:MAG: N-acetyltransferase [Reyranella sp.]|uniref:GNAT family N-acetyltransferase n=1 Tax=Reyranella sp. TaxID=1929291 RepID=UPI001ACC4BD0|nr:N-acetyltransferase [Reyranella sp.]MBN9085932.1 N-acetyltransferase [Reyranella sp.]
MAGARRQDDVVIRPRAPADDAAIAEINDSAFGGTGESKLVHALRDAGLVAIDLVALESSDLVGHVLFSDLDVAMDGRSVKALALAPVAVRPDRQRRGIGSALIRRGLDLARTDGWAAVIVLGDPAYYPRFGFSAAAARPLRAPFSGDAFMALPLRPGALEGCAGRVVYPAAFDVVS